MAPWSNVPMEQTVWQVAEWRDGNGHLVVLCHRREAKVLEAAGLSE